MSNNLGLIGYDFVEFYVGSAKMWAYWHTKAMGLQVKAYLGPETVGTEYHTTLKKIM
jgi:4-hydroxyphenylpyruvate dioxygenase